DDRLMLIGYYTSNGHGSADRLRLRSHVLWMISNHPEHASTAEPSLRDLPDDPEGNSQILELWKNNLGSYPNDLPVLKNAEKFISRVRIAPPCSARTRFWGASHCGRAAWPMQDSICSIRRTRPQRPTLPCQDRRSCLPENSSNMASARRYSRISRAV